MKFRVVATDGKARTGILETPHGEVETPVFMPVGTQGSVKAISQRDLKEIGASLILGNTYHLYLRPGTEVIRTAGGLHRFISWDRPMLTDSGGYQVFSLTDLRRIEEEGVTFQSHIDGSRHAFTPERTVEIQRDLGSDIMMALDECAPYPCDAEYAKKSNDLTMRWAHRCVEAFIRIPARYGHQQAIFGIVQGSVFKDVREQSARGLVALPFDGFALGGLAVGEPVERMYEITEFTEAFLPADRPRYLMGVGRPENLLESVERGMDMFDCVLPTRNGRNAMLFTRKGTLNIKNAPYATQERPVDAECSCYTCRNFSRAYIRHLFHARELLALQLATIHNLHFFLWFMKEARHAIRRRRFAEWKRQTLSELQSGQVET